MIHDAIIVFSAGVMPLDDGGWRTTTYNESDAFGTLGGRDRVEAAALLANTYPNAYLVTTCRRADGTSPTLASTYTEELHALGVPDKRIINEEVSINTGTSIEQVLKLAQKKGWKNLLLLSSEYQLSRIAAFFEEMKSDIKATAVSSESVLIPHDPAFAERFEQVKKTPEYQKRLAAEACGIAAIKNGTYRPMPIEDKKERPM